MEQDDISNDIQSEDIKNIHENIKTAIIKPNKERALRKIISSFLSIGLSRIKIELIKNIIFGWLEEYLDGATCPKCFTNLGHAKDVPEFTICTSCNNAISPIKITPIRLYLSLANDADIFSILPDKIKSETKEVVRKSIGKHYSSAIISVYDGLSIEVIIESILAWMKENRPDLYYTIVFFPKIPEYIQILYEIKMNRIKAEDIEALEKKIEIYDDVKNLDIDKQKEVLIKVITESLDYAIEEMGGISTIGLKKFVRMIENIKFKAREMLIKALS